MFKFGDEVTVEMEDGDEDTGIVIMLTKNHAYVVFEVITIGPDGKNYFSYSGFNIPIERVRLA